MISVAVVTFVAATADAFAVVTVDYPEDSTEPSAEPWLQIDGGNESSHITLSAAPDQLFRVRIFSDVGLEIAPGAAGNCDVVDAYTADCGRDDLVAYLNGGDDSISLDGVWEPYTPAGFRDTATVFLGEGNDSASGNDGVDVIRGEAGDDSISGSGGYDELAGGDGADTLRGGGGVDRLWGARGRDQLFTRDGETDYRALCGPGRDYVRRDRGEFAGRDCEVQAVPAS